ncbi:MAG: GDSL-type esterase/lipase family protein [Chthoniobacteraceae bacterium]|jgi:lysophospholipase L1-like esterase
MTSQFESELCAFDHSPAPPGAEVFYGSSSIRLWDNLAHFFPGHPVVNRGFGGSTLAECIHLIPRVIQPLRPAALILYAADNDLDQGASPEHAHWLFGQFIDRIREPFPSLPIAFISVKPSPARFWNISNIRRANELIRDAAPQYPGVTYIDVFSSMLSPAGGSRPDLFTDDGLHMNANGYNLWASHIHPWLAGLSLSV